MQWNEVGYNSFPGQYSIEAEIETGSHRVSKITLPRINFATSETDFPFVMIRRQFPIRLAFAMTINKAQGQSLRRVGNLLEASCFCPWTDVCRVIQGLEFRGKPAA